MDAKTIALKAYPGYKGHKFSYHICKSYINDQSYWDGGSRTYYQYINFGSKEQLEVLETTKHTFHTARKIGLKPGWACVTHTVYCGKDQGLTVYFHPDNADLIPKKAELTDNEKVVLIATATLKNSYGGRSNIRFHEAHRDTRISQDDWDTTKEALIKKGLLLKNGGITSEGRHAVESMSLSELGENMKVKAIPQDDLPLHIDKRWIYESSKRIFSKRLSEGRK